MASNKSPKQNPFQDLVQDLSDILGPSSGLDSKDVNVDEVLRLMREYESMEEHWSRYAIPNKDKAVTRNLVSRGNGKSNLVRAASPIFMVLDLDFTPATTSMDALQREPDS